MTRSSSREPLQIGVLILPPVQLLDVSPVDLFGMLQPEYLKACNLPSPLVSLGIPVQIHYVSPENNDAFASCTSNAALRITASIKSEVVQPGSLDVLLIPGPDPNAVPGEDVKEFVRLHLANEKRKTDILTVCTGIFVAGYAGILDGKTVTGPRALVDRDLKPKFPKARWVEKRWVQSEDQRIWTSGGITNGQDMIAAYLRAHDRITKELVDLVCAMADVGERAQEYETSKVRESSWFLWLIFRSWWKGQ